MKSFSQRIGKKAIPTIIQNESADERLRTDLWNLLFSTYWNNLDEWLPSSHYSIWNLVKSIWANYYGQSLDEITMHKSRILSIIKNDFLNSEWNEMFDILEFVPNNFTENHLFSKHHPKNIQFINEANLVLERNLSAYRFIDGLITKIGSELEVSAVKDALSNSGKYSAVNEHLHRALELYSDRNNPNYRNSISESINAIEALCKLITGDEKATLGQAIKIVEQNHNLHSALKSAFSNLYGYASDEGGIRHSLLEESNLKQEDARFMLVICSAFVNYLLVKIG